MAIPSQVGGPTVCGGTIDSVQMLSEAFRRGVDCG